MVTIKTVNHCIKPSVYKHTPIYVCTYICYIQIESRKRKHINYRCSCMYAYSKYMCLYVCKCACLTCAYKHVLNFFSNYTSSLTGRFHRCTCIQIIFCIVRVCVYVPALSRLRLHSTFSDSRLFILPLYSLLTLGMLGSDWEFLSHHYCGKQANACTHASKMVSNIYACMLTYVYTYIRICVHL